MYGLALITQLLWTRLVIIKAEVFSRRGILIEGQNTGNEHIATSKYLQYTPMIWYVEQLSLVTFCWHFEARAEL